MVGTPLAAPASSGPGQLQAAKSYIKDKQAKTTAAKTTELLKKGAKAKTDTKTDELRAELKRKVNEIKKMNKLKKELQKKHNKLIDGAPANSANQKAAKTTKKSSKPKSKEKKSFKGLIDEHNKAMQNLGNLQGPQLDEYFSDQEDENFGQQLNQNPKHIDVGDMQHANHIISGRRAGQEEEEPGTGIKGERMQEEGEEHLGYI